MICSLRKRGSILSRQGSVFVSPRFPDRLSLHIRTLVVPMLEVFVNCGFLGKRIFFQHGHHATTFFGGSAMQNLVELGIPDVVFFLKRGDCGGSHIEKDNRQGIIKLE